MAQHPASAAGREAYTALTAGGDTFYGIDNKTAYHRAETARGA
jgi:hypothetical protein